MIQIKLKNIVLLSLMLFTILLLLIPINHPALVNNFNNNTVFAKEASGSTYSPSINGTGPQVNVTLTENYQNNTHISMNNSLTSNTTLTVHSPLDNNFNTSAVNLTMSSLQMANVK